MSAKDYANKQKINIVLPITLESKQITSGVKYQDPYTFAEAYHRHKLEVSDQEINNKFNTSPNNHIHPDRYRAEGAKWMLKHLKEK